MNYLKTIGLAAIAALAIVTSIAGTASATTIEVNGVAQNKSVEWSASSEPGTSTTLVLTNGTVANSCALSSITGSTTTFTAESSKPIGGPVSGLSFSSCTSAVTVDGRGSMSVEWISGTTNGTIRLVNTEVTVPSAIGTLTCKTGSGVDIGTMKGVATGGKATMDINAVLNCGFLAPSVAWSGKYLVTSPTGKGIVK